jgi:hypothetical protein
MAKVIGAAQGHPALTLKFKGVFDYQGLCIFIVNWLKDRNYEVIEQTHKHKMSCPHGFEIERVFNGERKVDDYYMYKYDVKLYLLDAHEVDAVKNGKPVRLWNARMEVKLGFDVVCDYANRWEKTPFTRKLHNFYCEYIIKKEIIIKHADSQYYKLLSLHTKIKEFLGMETATQF